MTRSVEIREAAVEAGARILNPNLFAKPDAEDWQDVVRGTARAVLEAAAPHLVEQEEFPNGDTGTALAEWLYNRFSGRRGPDSAPWVARTAETHGYWEHEAEAVLRALPYLAPAGDGGLREALESRKATLHDWVADWPTNNEYEAWTDEIEFIERTLAAHPAAPAVPQPAADRERPATTGQALIQHQQHRTPQADCEWCPEPTALPQPVERRVVENAARVMTDAIRGYQDESDTLEPEAVKYAELLRDDGLLAAQPVDREALAEHLRSQEIIATESGGWDTPTKQETERIADAVLAVLAGEQEQVEK